MQKGKFIVLEGIDGVGKTAQIGRLAEYIRSLDKYNEVLTAREPTRDAREVVARLTSERDPNFNALAMAEGYVLYRNTHYLDLIGPTLKAGADVVCDRFTLSTLAYQGTQGIPLQDLIRMHRVRGLPAPDLTIYLDLSAQLAHQRMHGRGDAREKFDDIEFQERLGGKYKEIIGLSASDDDLRSLIGRVEVVDAHTSIDEIARNIAWLYGSLRTK